MANEQSVQPTQEQEARKKEEEIVEK